MSEFVEDKKFRIEKEPDQSALQAIRLREQMCDDQELSNGTVRLGVRILDMALNPYLNNGRRGEIIVSQMKLGCLLNCDERSVRRRTDELVRTNYIWTSLVPRQNTKMMLCYHFTAFQPKRQVEQHLAGDGLWGNGKRRFDSGFTKTGKEATGHQRRSASLLLDQFGQKVFASLLENTPATGQKCPLSPDKIVRCDRTELSSGTGQNCPVIPDKIGRSHRPELSGVTGQNCPVREDASVRLKESQIGDSVLSSKGERTPAPQDKAFEVWERGLKGQYTNELVKLRTDFTQKVKSARTETARAEFKRRLAAVEVQLYGPPVEDQAPKQKPGPARAEPKGTAAMSKEELLESARNAVALGSKFLTDSQRQALQEAGE